MAGKSLEQRIADTEERIRQLQTRKQVLVQQARKQDRKDRTHRLIRIGGIMSRLGIDTLEKAHALQREVDRRPEVQEWLSKVAQRARAQPPTKPTDEA